MRSVKVKVKDRRRKKRWQVAVLVRCSIPKFHSETFELEMWAKDVNDTGMKLEWSRGLAISQIQKSDGSNITSHPIRFDDIEFHKGAKVKVQDLFYDDEGSPFIEGIILWARRMAANDAWHLGIQFTDKKGQSKDNLGAFKDFLKVVKSPTSAIEKASRGK